MSLKNTIAGIGLWLASLGATQASEWNKPLLLSEHTHETYTAVTDILMLDIKALWKWCADQNISLGLDTYQWVIAECLKNYAQGGYLKLSNYNSWLNLNSSPDKPRLTQYTEKTVPMYVLENNPEFERLLLSDLENMWSFSKSRFFKKVHAGELDASLIREEDKSAYSLYTVMKKYDFPISMFTWPASYATALYIGEKLEQ